MSGTASTHYVCVVRINRNFPRSQGTANPRVRRGNYSSGGSEEAALAAHEIPTSTNTARPPVAAYRCHA